MALLDANDLDFDFSGDLILGHDGDLKDTSEDWLLSLENQIRDLVKSEFGDWECDPNYSADLFDFIGEANTREMGEKIRQRVRSRILMSGLVPDKDLSIRVVPVHIHQVAILIKVFCNATPNNRLKFGEPIVVSFVYDTMEKSIFFQKPNTNNNEPF